MCSKKKSSNYGLLFVLIGAVIGILIKLFIFDVSNISGVSMEPTIKDKSTVIIYKLGYGLVKPFGDDLIIQWSSPKVNDIVLYFYNNKAVIKRCVAISGDLLEFSTSSGYSLSVNKNIIPLKESQYQRLKHNLVVPEGMILAVGDNYADSIDSREYGFVAEKNILGKVLFR